MPTQMHTLPMNCLTDGKAFFYDAEKRIKYAVVDCRIDKKTENALGNYAESILKLPPFSRLSPAVASHPDMLIWVYGKALITFEEYYLENRDLFALLEAEGYEIITDGCNVSPEYPHDIPLNCAVVGANILANKKAVSSRIKKLAEAEHLRLLHTNQGYAKCSTCIVSDNAIITADASIEAVASSVGIDVLRVESGHVALSGYNYGFIGGASGVAGDNVLFTGNLGKHPNADSISKFCARHGKRAISLTSEPLYDYGTVIFV